MTPGSFQHLCNYLDFNPEDLHLRVAQSQNHTAIRVLIGQKITAIAFDITAFEYLVLRLLLGSLMRKDYIELFTKSPQIFKDRICEQEASISPFVLQECMDEIKSPGNSANSLHQKITQLCIEFVRKNQNTVRICFLVD